MEQTTKDLGAIRGEINAIDEQLVKLIRQRLEIVEKVAANKKERGAPVFDPVREREILSKVAREVGPEYENGACLLFSTLMSISRARQRIVLRGEPELVGEIKSAMATTANRFPTVADVVCSGTEGSYAQQAVSKLFAYPTIKFVPGFEKVFDAVDRGDAPYGVLPVENSAAGTVTQVYDLMVKRDCRIVRALKLKVNHVLLGCRGAKLEAIKEVKSHPQALAQCSKYLKAQPWRVVGDINTAVAAKELAASGRTDLAVIASRACAELYGLDILADHIQDENYNYTRFICISKKLEIYPDARKFSIMLSLPHRPGSLSTILSKFAAIGVNITKLESRPIPGMDFEFCFIFDFEASPRDEQVLRLLAELADDPEIEHFTFLGAYTEA
ncbi:MAG: chorismate mutase [Kiritimatiellae bacterium]|nr:chorismate mutase [Kiritimatiellia bacterium]